MGVTSQVTDHDRFVHETGKGVASVRNVRVHDIDRGLVEPFIEHFGWVRERLKHRGMPYVDGSYGRYPLFRVGLTCTPLQSLLLKAISSNF
jgi:hypothetical protein